MNEPSPRFISAVRLLCIAIFALSMAAVASFVTADHALADPMGYSVRSDADDRLYRIDLSTGIATDIGATGLTDIEGLAFQPGTKGLSSWRS